jgi:hypothetical protein
LAETGYSIEQIKKTGPKDRWSALITWINCGIAAIDLWALIVGNKM